MARSGARPSARVRTALVLAAVTAVAVGVAGTVAVQQRHEARPATIVAAVPRTPPREVQVVRRGSVNGYLAFLPPGYDRPHTTWPAIVYLHGAGERGDGGPLDLGVLGSVALPRLAATGTLPATARGFVILAPQTDAEYWHPQAVHRWLAAVLPRYRVDPKRLYLTGISMGGQGVFDYLDRYGDANEFAAMAPVAGNFTALPVPDGLPSCQRMSRTPLWAFHGDRDDVNGVQDSIEVVAFVDRECQPLERLKLTVLLGTFHDSWTATYDLSAMRAGAVSSAWDPYSPDLYTWLLAHTRPDHR